MEKLLENISFNAANIRKKSFTITAKYVKERLENIVESEDLSRYIL
jgi:ATP-dependent HslUV protease ATP-binding subunit HslU